MNGNKQWWTSKGVWGGVIAAISVVGGALFHHEIPAADQSAIVDAVIQIATAVGALLAIYGRVVAQTKIGSSK